MSTVWTTLLTGMKYFSGVLTLDHALRKHNSKYPLVVLYLDHVPEEGLEALDRRGIARQRVDYLSPAVHKDFGKNERFNGTHAALFVVRFLETNVASLSYTNKENIDCWAKMNIFRMTQYERIVMLDSDMIILQNMDELMDIKLTPEDPNSGALFAASHACVCNPGKIPTYPKNW